MNQYEHKRPNIKSIVIKMIYALCVLIYHIFNTNQCLWKIKVQLQNIIANKHLTLRWVRRSLAPLCLFKLKFLLLRPLQNHPHLCYSVFQEYFVAHLLEKKSSRSDHYIRSYWGIEYSVLLGLQFSLSNLSFVQIRN